MPDDDSTDGLQEHAGEPSEHDRGFAFQLVRRELQEAIADETENADLRELLLGD